MQYVVFLWDLVKAGLPLAVVVAVAYVGYTAVKKGVPAARDLVVGWWNKGKVIEQRIVALEKEVFGPKAPTGATGPSK